MFLEYVQPIIRANAELFGLLTFFIGLGVGHWLAIGRDKRKEFNDAAIPVRKWLIEEIKLTSPYGHHPTDIELDTFIQCLHTWQQRGFRLSYEKQKNERAKAEARDKFGGVFYKDTFRIVEHLRKCLPYTVRK